MCLPHSWTKTLLQEPEVPLKGSAHAMFPESTSCVRFVASEGSDLKANTAPARASGSDLCRAHISFRDAPS